MELCFQPMKKFCLVSPWNTCTCGLFLGGYWVRVSCVRGGNVLMPNCKASWFRSDESNRSEARLYPKEQVWLPNSRNASWITEVLERELTRNRGQAWSQSGTPQSSELSDSGLIRSLFRKDRRLHALWGSKDRQWTHMKGEIWLMKSSLCVP